jgi:hypothetical protein
MKPRLIALLAMLSGTAWLAASGEATVLAATARTETIGAAPPSIRGLQPRELPTPATNDPFQPATVTDIEVAPAPINAVPPAPTFRVSPQFRVIGKQQESDQDWTVFLARGDDTWIVRNGDEIDAEYRVTAIHPPTLTLIHLKSRSRHTLDIGDAPE